MRVQGDDEPIDTSEDDPREVAAWNLADEARDDERD
jgi:hypothetical protein